MSKDEMLSGKELKKLEKQAEDYDRISKEYDDNELFENLCTINQEVTAIFELLEEGDYIIVKKEKNTKDKDNKIKIYNVYNDEWDKIGEFVEFSDGWGYIHYIPVGKYFPYNEFAKAKSIKINLTKNGFIYKKVN